MPIYSQICSLSEKKILKGFFFFLLLLLLLQWQPEFVMDILYLRNFDKGPSNDWPDGVRGDVI